MTHCEAPETVDDGWIRAAYGRSLHRAYLVVLRGAVIPVSVEDGRLHEKAVAETALHIPLLLEGRTVSIRGHRNAKSLHERTQLLTHVVRLEQRPGVEEVVVAPESLVRLGNTLVGIEAECYGLVTRTCSARLSGQIQDLQTSFDSPPQQSKRAFRADHRPLPFHQVPSCPQSHGSHVSHRFAV